jgi:hypothetical protein
MNEASVTINWLAPDGQRMRNLCPRCALDWWNHWRSTPAIQKAQATQIPLEKTAS